MLKPPLSWAFVATARLPKLGVSLGAGRLYISKGSFPTSGLRLRGLVNKDVAGWRYSSGTAAADWTRHLGGARLHRRRLAMDRRIDTAEPLSAGQGTPLPDATALVKQLRERTAVSVGLCKQALKDSNWDMEAAVLYLRRAGIARVAKASLREAREGLVALVGSSDGNSWSAVVLNCETDFVQRNSKFVSFSKALAEHCAALASAGWDTPGSSNCAVNLLKKSRPSAELCTSAQSGEGGQISSVDDILAILTTQFGEKIDVSAVERLDAVSSSCVGAYVHGEIEPGVGRVAALVEIRYAMSAATEATSLVRKRLVEFAKLLAMQVVATQPKFISIDAIPSAFVDAERAVVEETATKQAFQASASGSTAADLTQVIADGLKRSLEEHCLLQQEFLMMRQVHNDILGDTRAQDTTIYDADLFRRSPTVADVMQLVGRRSGCSLEISRMRLLTVKSK